MRTRIIYGAIAVADIERAISWYAKLFGRDFDKRPMKSTAEWQLTSGGGVQLVLDAKRAGQSLLTVGLEDLETTIKEVKSRGVELKSLDGQDGPFLLAQVTDPDGNLITFAQPNNKS